MLSGHEPLLIVLVGPTAVGKTEIAIQLAERLDGEIVSADSRLFYRGMDIGTAKPTIEERRRVPHHLIDVADPDQSWSLALFQREAHRVIASIHARKRLPFLVGGTGQYIQAVLQAWVVPITQPNTALRKALDDWANQIGNQGLHQRLATLDPQAAQLIDYRNLRRTVRALEVILSTGMPFTSQRQRTTSPYHVLTIGLSRPRSELYERIDERIQTMLDTGLEDEVRRLLELGYTQDLPALSAIGYREMIDYVQGKTSMDEAVTLIKRKTRVYVRRQTNWFKPTDPTIHWFDMQPGTVDEIETIIRSWLAEKTTAV